MSDKILTALTTGWLFWFFLLLVSGMWLFESAFPAEYASMKFRLGLLLLTISGAMLSRIIADITKVIADIAKIKEK